MTIQRYSSRTHLLDQTMLLKHLEGARSYKRIAGYFTSSLFEVSGELLETIPQVQIVCNVDIHPDDLKVAKLREARMIGSWNDLALEAEALLNRDRYRLLDRFLQKHGQAVRVAPDHVCGFLHGKAGVIECANGSKLGFIGSMNETRSGWQHHYEILWEDSSPEGVKWIEDEFDYIWRAAKELPDAVIREVHRRSDRHEVSLDDVDKPEDIAPAALIESPLYRQGLSLQPWQRGFLTECLRHHANHGLVRLLLADEVGLGKTLSLGTAALALCLLQDQSGRGKKPVAIFAPATLCEQWQTEMIDKLGIPCARWHTGKKLWLDHDDNDISPTGHDQISRCPRRIGIVSTGLMMRDSEEKERLQRLRFGLVILDEAHKARTRQGYGKAAGTPNELLAFIRAIAERSDHVLLGTATPIQTHSEDLWDLMSILDQGDGHFVLGNEFSPWHKPDEVLPLLAGKESVQDPGRGWNLLRSPLPVVASTDEPGARKLFSFIREDLGMGKKAWDSSKSQIDLSIETREILEEELQHEISGATFFQRENPCVRHIVLRKRTDLENAGLLPRVGVDLHPDRQRIRQPQDFDVLFEGKALRTSEDFREAYQEAQAFGRAVARRGKGSGGFMKNLMEQRVCSSISAGLATAKMLISRGVVEEETEDEMVALAVESRDEDVALQRLVQRLEQVKEDPKLQAVVHFLEHEGWLDYGVIIFSQYYDTAQWIAESLAARPRYGDMSIGLYAGASRSRLYRQGDSVRVEREHLKKMVAEREIRVMVATDAACEGLNLQTLGALINIDLPWNPTRLEQRIGRIKRFGQTRDSVDVLNLVNERTVDEKVYGVLSERMQDRFDLFGSLPDTIRAEWIEHIETIGEEMEKYINAQEQATGFDVRYRKTIEPTDKDWRDCTKVLSRRDFADLMRAGW